MSTVEIPLLRESAAFVARLTEAARRFGESPYRFCRRINWSHRYGETFYAREAACFRQAPDAYLAGRGNAPSELEDVYLKRLRPRQLGVAAAKVLAHWLFRVAGRLSGPRIAPGPTYRKCYVDDIELVFDPAEAGVLRAVYPFPINLARQRRYLAFLRRSGHPFRLAGYPYRGRDLLALLRRRDVRTLMRMESRAQIRHAAEVAGLGYRTVQLSDEFDIGSLDFCRLLARRSVRVVNSAHGVGKYLPVHAYQEFHVLTHKQREYYRAVHPCRYSLRALNDRAARPETANERVRAGSTVDLVFLSQSFAGVSEIIAANEARVVARLRDAFAQDARVRLLYKAHPNRETPQPPEGFTNLADIAPVNARPGTIYVSFFSTCQIDPSFKGRKVLLRGELIHPEIAFDDSETIVDVDGLVRLVVAHGAALQPGSPALLASEATC